MSIYAIHTLPLQLFLFHNVFLIISFSQRLSHNVFLTTSLSQRLHHNVSLTTSYLTDKLNPISLRFIGDDKHFQIQNTLIKNRTTSQPFTIFTNIFQLINESESSTQSSQANVQETATTPNAATNVATDVDTDVTTEQECKQTHDVSPQYDPPKTKTTRSIGTQTLFTLPKKTSKRSKGKGQTWHR